MCRPVEERFECGHSTLDSTIITETACLFKPCENLGDWKVIEMYCKCPPCQLEGSKHHPRQRGTRSISSAGRNSFNDQPPKEEEEEEEEDEEQSHQNQMIALRNKQDEEFEKEEQARANAMAQSWERL